MGAPFNNRLADAARGHRDAGATPGFLVCLVTQDVNDPESLYTFTCWEDIASLRAWESSDEFEKVFVAAIRPYIIGSSSVSLYEVKVESLAGRSAMANRDAQP